MVLRRSSFSVLVFGDDPFDLRRRFIGKKQAPESNSGFFPFPAPVGKVEGGGIKEGIGASVSAGEGEGAAGAVGEGAAVAFLAGADIL